MKTIKKYNLIVSQSPKYKVKKFILINVFCIKQFLLLAKQKQTKCCNQCKKNIWCYPSPNDLNKVLRAQCILRHHTNILTCIRNESLIGSCMAWHKSDRLYTSIKIFFLHWLLYMEKADSKRLVNEFIINKIVC